MLYVTGSYQIDMDYLDCSDDGFSDLTESHLSLLRQDEWFYKHYQSKVFEQ